MYIYLTCCHPLYYDITCVKYRPGVVITAIDHNSPPTTGTPFFLWAPHTYILMSTQSSSSSEPAVPRNMGSPESPRRGLIPEFTARTPAQLSQLPDNEREAAIHSALVASAADAKVTAADRLLDGLTAIMQSPALTSPLRRDSEQGPALSTKLLMSSLSQLNAGHSGNVLEMAFFLWKMFKATGLTWEARAAAVRAKCNGASAITSSADYFNSECNTEEAFVTSCRGVLRTVDASYQDTISDLVGSPRPVHGDFPTIKNTAEKIFNVHEWISQVLCPGVGPDTGCTASNKAKLLVGMLPAQYQAKVRDSLVSRSSQEVTFDVVCTTVSNLERAARARSSVATAMAVPVPLLGVASCGVPAADQASPTPMAPATLPTGVMYGVSAVGMMEGTCYGCGQPGHLMMHCPSVVCYACKQKGHMAANCPTSVGRARDRSPSRQSSRSRSRSRDRDRGRDRDSDRDRRGRDRDGPRVCRRCDIVCGRTLADCPKYEGCKFCGSHKHLPNGCNKKKAPVGTGNRLN